MSNKGDGGQGAAEEPIACWLGHSMKTPCLILLPLLLAIHVVAADVEAFGIKHRPIGNASLITTNGTLFVSGLGTNGNDGFSSFLGEAEFGAFLSPYITNSPQEHFTRLAAFGSVNGETNSPIGTLIWTNIHSTNWFASADYSPIGATSVTFQVWKDELQVAELTSSNGAHVNLLTSNPPPCINVWWRKQNGEWGGMLQPRWIGFSTNEVRLFIRPNGATSIVDFVSRTDVTAGGVEGMNLLLTGVQLGMFGHRHASIDSSKLDATNGVLTVSRFLQSSSNSVTGVLVEFDRSVMGEVQLRPLELAMPNSLQGQFIIFWDLGATHLWNSNGVMYLENWTPWNAIQVISNGVAVGSAPAPWNQVYAMAIHGMPRLTGLRATAEAGTERYSLDIFFDTNAVVTLWTGNSAAGNQIRLIPDFESEMTEVTGFSLEARSIPSFTIIGESSFTPPRLTITWHGTNALIRWPNPQRDWVLQMRITHDEQWRDVIDPITHANGYSSVTWFMASDTATCFFRLRHDVAAVRRK